VHQVTKIAAEDSQINIFNKKESLKRPEDQMYVIVGKSEL
jgi:hypothetical protein